MSTPLDHIYRRYLRLVRAQVERILRPEADSETDVLVREVFVKYWRAYGEREQQDPAALLFRMATYAAVGALRGRRRRHTQRTAFVFARPTMLEQASCTKVHALLLRVSREDAEAAALYFLANLSQTEIARTLATTQRDIAGRLGRFEKLLECDAAKTDWRQLGLLQGSKS